MVKQVIVIRKDLKMRRGKEIAQGAHASAMFLLEKAGTINHDDLGSAAWEWIRGNHRKVVVQVNSLEEIESLYNNAIQAGLKAHKVTDAGLTEFNGVPTVTALAIGPDFDEKIDPVTKHLPLY